MYQLSVLHETLGNLKNLFSNLFVYFLKWKLCIHYGLHLIYYRIYRHYAMYTHQYQEPCCGLCKTSLTNLPLKNKLGPQ